MPLRTLIGFALLACVACVAGCSGETGAKVTGVLIENGQPLKISDKERVDLSLTPVQKDEKNTKANPGAEFKKEDATFTFVGPGAGLVPKGEYRVSVKVRMQDGSDRLGGQFGPDNSPLTYQVTADARQQIVIDITKKTVTRK